MFLQKRQEYGILEKKQGKGGESMKIIHCSDLHLDSALVTNLSPEKARERSAELCTAFGRMVRYAVRERVDAVLIAGDLFDSAHVSAQTVDYVLEQMRSAPDVTFFCIRGNHDEDHHAFAGQKLPGNLVTFGTEWESRRCGDAVITAMEPEGGGWLTLYEKLKLHAQDLNIVMLHGQISTQPGIEQIALPLLRGKHIHYLALGHLHTYRKAPLDPDGEYCYCGCPEGRGFDECGEKGFALIETADGKLHSRFVPFAVRQLHEVPVDITDADTVTQILSRMQQVSVSLPREDLVKFVLRGTYTLQTQKDPVFLQKTLAPEHWFVKIKDESRLKIARETYEGDISLKGEFIRQVLASQYTQEDKERIISCGIRALGGEEVVL